MKTNYLFTRLALLLVGFSFLTACNKDKEEATVTQEKQDLAVAQSTVDLLSEIQEVNSLVTSFELPGMEGMPEPGGRKARLKEDACGDITYTTTSNSTIETITVDYKTGTTCDGELRKGKIIFTINSTATNDAFISIAAQFIGYESEGKKLSGNYTVKVNIDTADENAMKFVYSYVFKNATLTYQDGTKISWNSDYLLTFAFSFSEDNPSYSYTMTGGVSGTDRQSKAFSANITTPINLDLNCQYVITKGTYSIKTAGHPDATYDFGNGTCDNVATITINGKSTEVAVQD